MKTVPSAGCHRYRQDHLFAEATDTGAAGSHGQPHQLRPLSGLQQLHLCVSTSEQPRLEQPNRPLSFAVLCVLSSEDKLADVNSPRQCVGKLASSLWGRFPPRRPNALLYRRSLHPTHLCVTVCNNTEQSLGLNQPADSEHAVT